MHDGRQADAKAEEEAPRHAAGAAARHLIEENQFVERVELLGLHAASDLRPGVLDGPRGADDAWEEAGLWESEA